MKGNKHKKIVIIAILLCLVVGIGVFLVIERYDTKPTIIKIGYKKNNSGFQNLFVATSQNLFKKNGLNVEMVSFQSTDQMMQALALSHIDATPAGAMEVIAAVEGKSPGLLNIYATLVFDKETAFYSLLVPLSSSIKTISGLAGKKVGIMPGSSAAAWLRLCVKNFTDPDSVKLIALEPHLQIQALATGQVDALYTVDPIVTLAQMKSVAKVLVKGPENDYVINPMPGGAGVISKNFLSSNPTAARQFIKTMNEAIDYSRANPERTREIVAIETKLDPSVAKRIDVIRFWKIEETDYKQVQRYLDILFENKIIQKQISAKVLYIDAQYISNK